MLKKPSIYSLFKCKLWTCNGEAEILNSSSFGRIFSVLIFRLFDPRHDPVTYWNFVSVHYHDILTINRGTNFQLKRFQTSPLSFNLSVTSVSHL